MAVDNDNWLCHVKCVECTQNKWWDIEKKSISLKKKKKKKKKEAIIVLQKNKHCLFPLSWAAVLHLPHIISGGSTETEGLWKPCQELFKEKRKNCRVSGACAASALGSGLSLACWWRLTDRNNAASQPQWVSWRLILYVNNGFFPNSVFSLLLFKRHSQ